MATEWYCDLMGRIVGPLTAQELLHKVRRGEITGGTLIRKDDSRWYPAAEVSGLFEAAFQDAQQKRRDTNRIDYYEDL
jgi:hypothetical protein